MTDPAAITLLVGAGVAAGVVGTAGGITSLISYPALLAAGLSPLAADVTNLVALVACWPGAALTSRPELAGRTPWLRRRLPPAALGGAAGAALLLSTPTGAFARIVPFLVAAGAAALLAQPWLTAQHERRRERRHDPGRAVGQRLVLPVALALLTLYNGYFGAGSGVLILALLMILEQPHLPTANALKNMLLGAATVVPALVFAVLGDVHWTAAGWLAAGLFLGSTLGPRVARRVPADPLRWLVAVAGLAVAARLWWHPGP